MSSLSSWSIRHPVQVAVLFMGLAVAGVAGFSGLRQNNTPDMDIPTVTVTVSRPGAGPAEMETQVTRLVEDSVAGLGMVDHVRSTVTEGSSVTNVEFTVGTDVDRKTDDVRNAVTGIRASLPADVLEPTIKKVEATGQAVLTYVVTAPALAPDAVSWLVDGEIARDVMGARGVSRIERSGGVEREVRVRLDPDRALSLGVTASDVTAALRSVASDQPGGRAVVGEAEQGVRTLGAATSVESLAATRLPLPDGRSVRLSDVAAVEMSWGEPRQRARLDGREVVSFAVFRTVGTSEVAVAKAVRRRMEAVRSSHPGMSIVEVTSSTDWVEEGYDAALEALWIGGLLAVAVVWLFLRDWRATLVSSAALPLSLLPTFAVMRLLDQSLNNITLLAIALVVGVLVDDAIVEIENIVRHMRVTGRGAYRSSLEAADDIGLAVVATTMTIVAVFVPVGFMPGIPGQFFRAFAIAVAVSVLFSLLVARMLTPLLAAYVLRSAGHVEEAPRWMPAYQGVLAALLRNRWKTLGLTLAAFCLSLGLMRTIPVEFIPASDRGRSMLSVELPPGATLDEADAVARRVAAILARRPEVERVLSSVGTPSTSGRGPAGGGGAGEVRTATVTANLVPRGRRGLSQQAFEREVGPLMAVIPGARIAFGADGQSGSKMQVALVGDDDGALALGIERMSAAMRRVQGLRNVSSSASLAKPEVRIVPLPEKAAALGITAADIAAAVKVATLGDVDATLPKFTLEGRQVNIRVTLDEAFRSDLQTLGTLRVGSGDAAVPLSSVAEVGLGSGPNQITRLDRRRTASVEASLVGITVGQGEAALTGVALPPGVERRSAGDGERMAELLSGFAFAVLSGILGVYGVLVLLFGGFLQPATILMALPLSLGGALSALALTGSSFSMSALIGLLMLMGICAKNSILLVEHAIATARTGKARRESVLEAARDRARPILMTTVAMVAGMAPIALGIGADAEFRAPMAVAVIGGLLSSTLLSLLVVPVAYEVVDDVQRWLARVLGGLVSGPADGDVVDFGGGDHASAQGDRTWPQASTGTPP